MPVDMNSSVMHVEEGDRKAREGGRLISFRNLAIFLDRVLFKAAVRIVIEV